LIPNKILRQLGEGAARYNTQTLEHAPNCCRVCRRLLVDMIVTLTDPSNWEPDPLNKQIERLQGELEMLKEAQTIARVAAPAPVAPVGGGEESPEGGFFQPPGRSEDE
jgi:hypothetical protein